MLGYSSYQQINKEDIPLNRPSGNWITYQDWKEVAGINYRFGAVMKFIRAVEKGTNFTTTLKREPDNKFDENAIAVIVTLHKFTWFGSNVLHIGYIPAYVASGLNETYSVDMPIAGEITKIRYKSDRAYINIGILIPGAKERKRFEV